MSTWYHLVCDEHRVVSYIIGGRSFPHRWWEQADGSLASFLEEHADCKPSPRLVSEHAPELEDETFTKMEPDAE